MREKKKRPGMTEKEVIKLLERKDYLWIAGGIAVLGFLIWAIFLM